MTSPLPHFKTCLERAERAEADAALHHAFMLRASALGEARRAQRQWTRMGEQLRAARLWRERAMEQRP